MFWRRHRSARDVGLRSRLTREQYRVTQRGATERPFSNAYHDCGDAGSYRCVVCDHRLFDSEHKYDSRTGWPSFDREIADGSITRHRDRKLGLLRVEARCASCDAHLGHIFPDGPASTGERYCMNSAALRLDRRD